MSKGSFPSWSTVKGQFPGVASTVHRIGNCRCTSAATSLVRLRTRPYDVDMADAQSMDRTCRPPVAIPEIDDPSLKASRSSSCRSMSNGGSVHTYDSPATDRIRV